MSRYFDRRGHPMELTDWAKTFEVWDNKIVANDKWGDVTVSTVWLGLDHQFEEGGPPLIFETMIFGGDYDEYQRRYSTEKEALAGHIAAMALAFGD